MIQGHNMYRVRLLEKVRNKIAEKNDQPVMRITTYYGKILQLNVLKFSTRRKINPSYGCVVTTPVGLQINERSIEAP